LRPDDEGDQGVLNLSYLLTRSAKLWPDAPAVLRDGLQRNYRELDHRVSRLASALKGLGIAAGARIGVICNAEPRGLEALFGPLRAGLVIVPMNPKLHPHEHAYMLANCGASALICGAEYVQGLMEVRREMPADMHFIAIDDGLDSSADCRNYEDLLATGDPGFADEPIEPDDTAWLFYTSGTTGKPKGAMLTHRNIMAMLQTQLIDINPAVQTDRLAYVAPISHSAGLMSFHHIARGAAHVFPSYTGFSAGRFYELVERYRITTCFMVPTMIQMLLDDGSHRARDISSLHTIVYGGSPMYVDRLQEAVAAFGPIFVQLFAQGEAPMGCTALPKAAHLVADAQGVKRLGSAGRECHQVEVRIADREDNFLPAGTTGEILVRGDLVMKGYWGNPEATRETLRNGWLHTGDVGYLDEEGYLFITDRSKDVIITGGYNVYPREIEEVLYGHEGVLEATVFGLPDPKWIERVVAAVVVRKGYRLTADELIDYCRGSMAGYKKPTEIRFFDELPKSDYGKILKREIRQQLIAHRPM
jgi:long-chain acyl-CoA synthetase